MNKLKINEAISLPQSTWKVVKEKTKEVKDELSSKDLEGTLILVRKQGSVSTRTIINPELSNSNNDIDLDLSIVLKKESIDKGTVSLKSIKEAIEKIFPYQTFRIKKKAITTTFELYSDEGKINLGMDIVFLVKDENGKMFVWNSQINQFEISEPFKLIDMFKEEAKKNPDLVYYNKLIKALKVKSRAKGLKSIFILNASLKAREVTLASIVDVLLEDIETLNNEGYVNSVADIRDKINAPSDFDYPKAFGFLKEIRNLEEDEIAEKLGLATNSQKLNVSKSITTATLFGKVHASKKISK